MVEQNKSTVSKWKRYQQGQLEDGIPYAFNAKYLRALHKLGEAWVEKCRREMVDEKYLDIPTKYMRKYRDD